MNAGTSLYRIQRFTPFRHDSATGAYACPMLIHGDQAMKRPLQYLIIGAALLIGSSGDVLAHCGRSHNVIAPHNGFSFGYGGPNINRYSHHYRPRQYGYGNSYSQPYNHYYGGQFNNHQRYYNRHRYYRPRWTPYNFRYNY